MTHTKLNEKRKKELKPSITYDLDGDGVVGGKDLVISKKFDSQNKGYLTEQEKSQALLAIKNGFENNFKWGIEQSGTLGAYRVVQK